MNFDTLLRKLVSFDFYVPYRSEMMEEWYHVPIFINTENKNSVKDTYEKLINEAAIEDYFTVLSSGHSLFFYFKSSKDATVMRLLT